MKPILDPTFWNDPDLDSITEPGPILLYMYLFSNSTVPVTGAYRLSMRQTCSETRMTPKDVDDGLKKLNGRIRYEEKTGWVWIPGYLNRQIKGMRNPNMTKSALNAFDALLKTEFPFKAEFLTKYESVINQLRINKQSVLEGEGEDSSLHGRGDSAKGGMEWDEAEKNWTGITEQDTAVWREAFQACDIRGQLAKARAWYIANPKKRKKNVRRFLTSWMSRSQERGGDIPANRPVQDGDSSHSLPTKPFHYPSFNDVYEQACATPSHPVQDTPRTDGKGEGA